MEGDAGLIIIRAAYFIVVELMLDNLAIAAPAFVSGFVAVGLKEDNDKLAQKRPPIFRCIFLLGVLSSAALWVFSGAGIVQRNSDIFHFNIWVTVVFAMVGGLVSLLGSNWRVRLFLVVPIVFLLLPGLLAIAVFYVLILVAGH